MYATLSGAYQYTVKYKKALGLLSFKNQKSNKPRVVFEKYVTNKLHFSFFNNVGMMLVPFTFLKSETVWFKLSFVLRPSIVENCPETWNLIYSVSKLP